MDWRLYKDVQDVRLQRVNVNAYNLAFTISGDYRLRNSGSERVIEKKYYAAVRSRGGMRYAGAWRLPKVMLLH